MWADLIIFVLVLVAALSICIDTARLGISPMPSSKKVRKAVRSFIGKGKIYELGSGWGTLALELSRDNQVIAFEKALIPWLFSKINQMVRGASQISILRKDIYSANLSDADIVFCYLYPGAMKRLSLKFEEELKYGAIVISNSFQIPGRKPDKIIEVNDWGRSKLYCYIFSNAGSFDQSG